MKIYSSIRHLKIYSNTSTKKNQTKSYSNKIGLTKDIIENCRTNLANYYVCYGSAVVSVRNAERKIKLTKCNIYLFQMNLGECKSQDIIIDMSTWLLLDSDSVGNAREILN